MRTVTVNGAMVPTSYARNLYHRKTRRCVACGAQQGCRWVDTEWVCSRCGGEWTVDHDPVDYADYETLWAALIDGGKVPARVIDAAHLQRQKDWSARTFGPGRRTAGVIDHIRRELTEVEADPTDLNEWVDVLILAFDGAWRHGHSPQAIIDALIAKQARNEQRVWPDWRGRSEDA